MLLACSDWSWKLLFVWLFVYNPGFSCSITTTKATKRGWPTNKGERKTVGPQVWLHSFSRKGMTTPSPLTIFTCVREYYWPFRSYRPTSCSVILGVATILSTFQILNAPSTTPTPSLLWVLEWNALPVFPPHQSSSSWHCQLPFVLLVHPLLTPCPTSLHSVGCCSNGSFSFFLHNLCKGALGKGQEEKRQIIMGTPPPCMHKEHR